MTIELPTEENHFKAQFNPWIGVALISVGLLLSLLFSRSMLISGTFSFRLFIGVLLVIVGWLYLTRPYFAIAPNRFTVYNFFGQTVKRYPFVSFDCIEIDGGRVYIRLPKTNSTVSAEAHELVKVQRWMTKATDWQRLKRLSES